MKTYPLVDTLKTYPLVDTPRCEEREALALNPGVSADLSEQLSNTFSTYQNRYLRYSGSYQIRCAKTGEFRAPKAGEWFISGALIEGYRANCDYSVDKYHIAKLVLVKHCKKEWIEIVT